MQLYEAQNYFSQRMASMVTCLKGGCSYHIDPYTSNTWGTIREGDKEWVVTHEGAYVAELSEGRLSHILEDHQSVSGGTLSGSINGGFADANGTLNLTKDDGNIISIDMNAVTMMSSPRIDSVETIVNDLTTKAYVDEAKINDLEKLVRELQPKKKKLTFATKKVYKLK